MPVHESLNNKYNKILFKYCNRAGGVNVKGVLIQFIRKDSQDYEKMVIIWNPDTAFT